MTKCGALALLALAGLAVRAAAQLRPPEPLDWEVFAPGNSGLAHLGAALLQGQRASLAGTEGPLLELGNFAALVRSGRVALELSGTLVRRLDDRSRWADTAFGATPGLRRRVDAGDLRIATAVRLTPACSPGLAVLRFGARLPTTANTRGLDRGETDFLGTLALGWQRGALLAGVESGIGILGTRIPEFEQQDDWIYSARVAYRVGAVQPVATFTGQTSPLRYRRIRGNEDLRELRLGIRAGGRRWLEAQWVHGFLPFSPRSGVLLSAGAAFPSAAR
jgi:hypothetical protein